MKTRINSSPCSAKEDRDFIASLYHLHSSAVVMCIGSSILNFECLTCIKKEIRFMVGSKGSQAKRASKRAFSGAQRKIPLSRDLVWPSLQRISSIFAFSFFFTRNLLTSL